MSRPSLLELDSISVSFGPVRVLQDVSARFEHDETYAVVGPSGSGKSTLLAVIADQLPTLRGSVRWNDGKGRPAATRIAWIGQLPVMLPGRTAAENVVAACQLSGVPRSEAISRAQAAIQQVGLAHRCDTVATRLSGGEQQRVAVARALATDRRLVLADEPTASLDRSNASMIGQAIVSARRPGTTVIIATHDLELASACRHQLTIADGRLVAG